MHRLLLLALVALTCCWTSVATAGPVAVRDTTSFLPPSGGALLIEESDRWPFAVHVLIEDVPSLNVLTVDAIAWVDRPDVVVVAVAPLIRKTVVRFGNGLGVPERDFDTIAAAGDDGFRAHDATRGIEAILDRTARARREGASGGLPAYFIPGVVAVGGILGAGSLVWWAWRSAREREEFEAYARKLREAEQEREMERLVAREARRRAQSCAKQEFPVAPASPSSTGDAHVTSRTSPSHDTAYVPPATSYSSPTMSYDSYSSPSSFDAGSSGGGFDGGGGSSSW